MLPLLSKLTLPEIIPLKGGDGPGATPLSLGAVRRIQNKLIEAPPLKAGPFLYAMTLLCRQCFVGQPLPIRALGRLGETRPVLVLPLIEAIDLLR